MQSWILIAAVLAFAGCMPAANAQETNGREAAVFAGGCFWCMEPPFDALDGVISTTSGYTGGQVADPTYEQVSAGSTGHLEAVQIVYDSDVVSYEELLDVFWRNVDPWDDGGQFCDRGGQYRSAIFYRDEQQRQSAMESRAALQERSAGRGELATEIREAGEFYPAEDYHQNYYRKNPIRYKFYRYTCGRDDRLTELWGEPPSH